MHEMGIAMQIVKIATAAIPNDAAGHPITRVNIKVGKLTAIVPDSLRFCFDIVSQETPLAGASLAIEEVAVKAVCDDCQHQWTIAGPVFVCPLCESPHIQLISGRELDVDSIEIAD